jgi:hypothetical protein
MTKRIIPMAAIDQIGKTVPNVILDTVIMNRADVDLRMHINEYLYEDGTGTWFTNNDYKEKLQIRITVKTDRGEAEAYVSCDNAEIDLTKTGQQQKIYYNFKFNTNQSQGFRDLFDLRASSVTSIWCKEMTITAETFISREKLSPPINFGPIPFVELAGAKSSVEVIKESIAQTRTVGYFLGNTFYTGPKTQLTNGRWVTGNARDESSEFLIERNVPNIKVMDNRDVFESTTDADTLLVSTTGAARNEPSAPYFSSLSATRDTNGFLRFVFTFDYKKAYSKNSLYGQTFDNLSDRLQDRVLLMSTLQSLTMKRSRTGTSFADLSAETIITSGEESGDRFIDINNDNAAIKEEELNFQKGTLYLRTFSGVDKLFKNISSGEYRYSTDVTFKDGIYKFLSFQSEDLKKSTAILAKYIDSLETYSNGILKESFIEQVKKENDFLNRPYIRALVSLSENIYFYNTPQPKKLINSIRSWLSPVTSTRDSIVAAYKLMNNIQGTLNNLMRTVRNDVSEATTQGMPRGNLIYDLTEGFGQKFDAADSFKNGLTFLSATEILEPQDPDGLVKMTAPAFEGRIENESVGFFNSKDVSFDIAGGQGSITSTTRTTSFTYLTPTAVRLNDQIFAVGTIKNLKATEGLDVNSLALGNTKSKYKSVLSKLRTSRITDAGTGTSSLDITPVSDPSFSSIAPEGSPNPQDGTVGSIANFGDSIGAESYDNPFDKLKFVKIIPSEDGDTVVLEGITGEQVQMTRDQFDLLPNYFKAILSGAQTFGDSLSEILDLADTGDIDPYSLIIGSTVKIEVLVDFKKNDATKPQTLIREPSWVPLTYELYRAQRGTNLLCRMVKYDNSAIGFKRSNDAAVFNHFFVLESPVISSLYGDDTNSLQVDINGARSIDDLINIFSNYGIDYDPDADASELEIEIGADGCAALADEKMIEDM